MNSSDTVILVINGENKGPYSVTQIKQMLTEGKIHLDTMCWRQNFSAPQPLRTQPEFSTQNSGNPHNQPRGGQPVRSPNASSSGGSSVRNIAVDIILTIVTCGLFNLYIQFVQIQAVNQMMGREKYKFLSWFLLTIITCGLYHIYHEYQKTLDITRALGREDSNAALVNLVLTLLGLSIVADAIQQAEINRYYGSTNL